MYGQEKKRSASSMAQILDLIHIAVGIIIVICAVMAFVNPEKNQFLFPLIFWLAATLYGVNGWVKLQAGKREKKKRIGGIVLCMVAAVLIVVGILSAVSIWR